MESPQARIAVRPMLFYFEVLSLYSPLFLTLASLQHLPATRSPEVVFFSRSVVDGWQLGRLQCLIVAGRAEEIETQ